MASSNWWFKFDFKAWRGDPALGRCTMETQGVWINAICAMKEGETASLTGTVPELCRIIGCFPDEFERAVAELERSGAADVMRCNDEVTLLSRRLQKELSINEANRLRVQKHRSNADVMQVSRDRVRDRVRDRDKKLSSREGVADATPPARRGTRLSDDFEIDDEMRTWATGRGITADLETETEKFRNYYKAITGSKAVRLDWSATWKNWILRAEERSNDKTKGGDKSGTAAKLDAYSKYFKRLDEAAG